MNTFRLFLLSPLGELVLRWTLLLALAWMANAGLRRSHPRRRLILWRGVLVIGCLLPFGGTMPRKVFQLGRDPALTSEMAPTNSAAPSASLQSPMTVPAGPAFALEPNSVLRAAKNLITLKSGATMLALVWIAGALAGGVRLLLLQRRLSRLCRDASEPDAELLGLTREVQARLGVRRALAVRVSSDVSSPFVCGLLHPSIILPAELLRTLPSDQIPALLSHEMAHLRSGDLAWCVGWRWMKTLGWLHPLMWNVPAAHNLACEQEADRIASDQWDDRSSYTRLLAQLTLRVMELPPVETTLALNGASQIVKRLALLRRDRFGGWKWRDSLTGLGLVAILALVAAGWGISTARAESPADELAQRLAEQRQPRTIVPFDPKQFDRYVGYYRMGPNVFATITREGDHFYAQLTGQSKFEIYPESPTKFFFTVVAAQISFVTDAAGNVTESVTHQNGFEQHAPKVDEAAVKTEQTALAERLKNGTPDPDREPPLRRFVDGVVKGQPYLEDMSPALLAAFNRQWPASQKVFQGAGAFKSLVFKNVNRQGWDVYLATFENKKLEYLIGPLNSDHKMMGLLMRPAP